MYLTLLSMLSEHYDGCFRVCTVGRKGRTRAKTPALNNITVTKGKAYYYKTE